MQKKTRKMHKFIAHVQLAHNFGERRDDLTCPTEISSPRSHWSSQNEQYPNVTQTLSEKINESDERLKTKSNIVENTNAFNLMMHENPYDFGEWSDDSTENSSSRNHCNSEDGNHCNDNESLQNEHSTNFIQKSSEKANETQSNIVANTNTLHLANESPNKVLSTCLNENSSPDNHCNSKGYKGSESLQIEQQTNVMQKSPEKPNENESQSQTVKNANAFNLELLNENQCERKRLASENYKTIDSKKSKISIQEQQHANSTETIAKSKDHCNDSIGNQELVKKRDDEIFKRPKPKPKPPVWWRLNNYYTIEKPEKPSITATINQTVICEGSQIRKIEDKRIESSNGSSLNKITVTLMDTDNFLHHMRQNTQR